MTDIAGALTSVNRQTKAGARGRSCADGEAGRSRNVRGQRERRGAQAYYLASDAACIPLFAITPFTRTGTLVLTAVSATRSPDPRLTFGNGTTLAGSFRTTTCGPLLQLNPTSSRRRRQPPPTTIESRSKAEAAPAIDTRSAWTPAFSATLLATVVVRQAPPLAGSATSPVTSLPPKPIRIAPPAPAAA